MEFSVFKSQAEAYQNTHTLNDNIRYILAKKKIDVKFSPLLFKKLQRNYLSNGFLFLRLKTKFES